MKNSKNLIFVILIICMFFGMNKLKATDDEYQIDGTKSGNCYYNIKSKEINWGVDLQIDFDKPKGERLKIVVTRPNTQPCSLKAGESICVNWQKTPPSNEKFLMVTDSEAKLIKLVCPKIYIKDVNYNSAGEYFVELSLNPSENKEPDEYPDGVHPISEQSSIPPRGLLEVGSEMSCEDIIGKNGQILVKFGLLAVRIITPILLFILTAFEFMKAIPQQDEDAIIKAWKRFGTRGVIAAIIMLLPTFLNILGMLTGIFDNCGIW